MPPGLTSGLVKYGLRVCLFDGLLIRNKDEIWNASFAIRAVALAVIIVLVVVVVGPLTAVWGHKSRRKPGSCSRVLKFWSVFWEIQTFMWHFYVTCQQPVCAKTKTCKSRLPSPLNKVPFTSIFNSIFFFLKSLLMLFVHLHVVILPLNAEVPAQTIGAWL